MDPITRLTAIGAAGAGGGDSYWIATLVGASIERAQAMTVDSSNNLYLAGVTLSAGAGGYDCLIAKYDSSGVIQWQRTLGAASYTDELFAIAVDSSGNIYIAGETDSVGAGSKDFLVAKYNSSGVIQWQRTLGGTSTDRGRGITVDSSGNVYVGGISNSAGAGGYEALIVKYDTSGVIQWQRTLGGTGGDFGHSMAIDSSANIYIGGNTESAGAGGHDCLIAKYNSSGVIQWQRILGGTGSDFRSAVALDASGNVYFTAYITSAGAGGYDILVAKYNTSGAIQWQRTLGGTGTDVGYSTAIDSLGNVYVVGYTNSAGAGDFDILIAKYDASGVIQWQRTLGGTSADYGQSIAIDSSDNVYVAGYTGASNSDVLIAKLPSDGSLTGTYGSFTYAASSLTDAACSLTDAASSLTDSASSLTDAACSLTDAACSLTSSTTTL